jgi:hypothetical protein
MPCFRELGDSDARLGILKPCNDVFLRVPCSSHGPLLWAPSQHSWYFLANGLIFGGEGLLYVLLKVMAVSVSNAD